MKDIIALKQSEKVALTTRKWFGFISQNGIELISDKHRFDTKKALIGNPKIIKLSKNIHMLYDQRTQIPEKTISAFVGKEAIRGDIFIAECLANEGESNCLDYVFEVQLIPLLKAIDNLLVPDFNKKLVHLSTLPVPF